MLAVIDELRDGRFEFVVLAPETGQLGDAIRARDVELVPMQVREDTRLPDADGRLLRAIHQARPDLVHANSVSMGILLGSVADQVRTPCVSHIRDIVGLSKSAIEKLNQNDSLIAVSRATKSFHVKQRLREDRVQVVYNGIDCEEFQPRRATGKLKRELSLLNEAFLIATVGQIGMRKGLDTLAESAALIGADFRSISFLIVGERYSQKSEAIEYESSVRRHFASAGLNSRVHWLGYRDDVPELLNEVDLLVHPANQEPLGRVLLEAGALGLPIIATSVGGTEEIFTDGQSASLIPPRSPESLAKAITQLFSDQNLRELLGRNARLRIQTAFSSDRSAAALGSIWSSFLPNNIEH